MNFIKKGFTSFDLKIIGIVLMFLDHTYDMFAHVGAPLILTILGRVVAPIFLFLSAEGYHYTRNKFKYMRNLLVGFWISNIIFLIVSSVLPNSNLIIINSIFGTLFLSLLTMWIWDGIVGFKKDKKYFWQAILALILMIAASFVIFLLPAINMTLFQIYMIFVPGLLSVEGGIVWVLLALWFHIFRGKRLIQIVGLVAISIFFAIQGDWTQSAMVFSAIFIWLYNGQKGRSDKWFFYIFYPTHIAFLYILSTILFPG